MAIHEFIRSRRKSLHLTLEELGEKIGVNKSTIQRYESNSIQNIPQKKLLLLCKALHCDLPTLLGLAEDHPPSHGRAVPLLGSIAAGVPIEAVETAEFYCIDPSIPADFCLRVKGDSMIGARIYDGDLVFLRRQDDVDDGQIAAVMIDQETTLKRVYKMPGRIQLRSENPKYPPLDYRAQDCTSIRIIGKAVAFQSRLV